MNVASAMAELGSLNLDNINSCPGPFYSDTIMYSNSKLYVVYMTWEFANKLKGTGVTVNCLHPGVVNTSIFGTQGWGFLYFLGTFCKYTGLIKVSIK